MILTLNLKRLSKQNLELNAANRRNAFDFQINQKTNSSTTEGERRIAFEFKKTKESNYQPAADSTGFFGICTSRSASSGST